MAAVLQPRDEEEVCDAIAEAAATHSALEIVGGGSKQRIGRPHREAKALSIGGFGKIIDYDPAELVLSVQAGVRLSEVEALLARHNQMLAFEPYDFAEVVGGDAGRSTMGGLVCAGLAGSRRISAGGVRDHVLGFAAVNGFGQRFKAGGKVVKNVTGYDLPKLMTGSWGQLAALVEVTLKVLPRPPVIRTLALRDVSIEAAAAAMTRAMSSRAEVAAASYVPALAGEPAIAAIRIEGFGPSVEARDRMLRHVLEDLGAADVMDASTAQAHWAGVRAASYLPTKGRPLLWRISVPPARGAELVSGIERLDGLALLDWAGGLAWARLPLSTSAQSVRAVAERQGGHAMLVDAPTEVRAVTPALHPEPAAIAALSRRVRQAFDPASVFDPQRFVAP